MHHQLPLVLAHDALRQAESNPRTVFSRCEKGNEDLAHDFFGDALSIVLHRDDGLVWLELKVQPDVRCFPTLQGMDTVAYQVDQDLLD